MKVKVITQHLGEGIFPTFNKGTIISVGDECSHFLNWYPCDINGYKTYIPKIYFTDNKLTCDYNPTELVAEVGEVLDVHEIVYAWLYATNNKGDTGWIPAEVVASVTDV